jgi:hypothetical protein
MSLFHVLRSRNVFDSTEASGPFYMFCAPGLIFSNTEGVGSRFNVLRSRTHFRRYRGRRVSFSCFALLDSFSAIPRVSDLVFMFCAPGLIFGGTEGVLSSFHVFRSRTCFWRYRSVGSLFHVLSSRTCFQRYRGHQVSFTCFALPVSFSAIPSALGLVFMFWALRLIFGRTEGVGSRFHVLRSRAHFRWYRGHSIPYSCFPLPDMFSAVPRASGPVFIFCAPGVVFGDTEGAGSRFHVLRSRTRFRRYRGRPISFSYFPLPEILLAVPRASGSFFMFCAPELTFGDTEGVLYRFHIFRSWTCFWRYRRRRVPFSIFAIPDSFSAVPRASGPVFKFCASTLIFGGTEGV